MFRKILSIFRSKKTVPDSEEENTAQTRTIKTARNSEEINNATGEGYWPLIKLLEPSDEIKTKVIIYQHKTTGQVMLFGDLRMKPPLNEDYEYISSVWYYPYKFESPYAAYLIPKDIQIGEKVFLEDLIEDYVDWCWNQGDATRLESCKAIWNGKDFKILYDKEDHICVIG